MLQLLCHCHQDKGRHFNFRAIVRLGHMREDEDNLSDDLSGGRSYSGKTADQLVREFNQSLVRMLQARLGSYEDAREVAQEAYAKLLNLGDGAAVNFHRAYLFRTAQNLATDLLRRRAYTEKSGHDILDFEVDPLANPLRVVAATQIMERLPALLAELPPKCAQAFRLVRVDQMSFGDAAIRLNLTERMIRIHVARALAHCQQRLEGISEGWNDGDE